MQRLEFMTTDHKNAGGSVAGSFSIDQRPKIVCLCGSSRFVDVMAVQMWELEKQGIIALGPHLLPQWYPGLQDHHQAEVERVVESIHELHLRKIDLADEILVINVDGYIGKSTSVEIDYAKKTGKPVSYLFSES